MKKTTQRILYLLCLLSIVYLSGCNAQEEGLSSPKLKESIDIISVKEIKKDNYEIEYELKKDLIRGSGLTTQSIYFDNGKTHTPLVSDKKGIEKLTIKGNQIKVVFNGANKYIEEEEIN